MLELFEIVPLQINKEILVNRFLHFDVEAPKKDIFIPRRHLRPR